MANEPIRFLYKTEITTRKKYKSNIAVAKDQLSHIVGVFEFDEKEHFHCGLNYCNQKHWHGVVIATKSGDETHCGLDCGAREFPEDFKNKHALFKNALRRADSMRTVLNLKEESARFISETQKIKESIEKVYGNIQSIRNALRIPTVLSKHFENIIKNGGIIEKSVRLTEEERVTYTGKRQFKSVAIGKIKGVVAARDFAKTSVEIDRIISQLRKIQSLNPENTPAKVINQLVRFNNNVKSDLNEARYFILQANLFLMPDNLDELRKLVELDGIRSQDIDSVLNVIAQIKQQK